MNPLPCYADGRAYRGLYSRFSGQPRPIDCRRDRVLSLTSPALSWPRLWQIADATLRQRGYDGSTRRLYRAVLRRFAAFAGGAPSQTTPEQVAAFVQDVDRRNGSWSWTAMSISVLRTVLDKLGGQRLATDLCGPKRPQRLPEMLAHETVCRVLAAAPTTRDQLLLGLLYGCGLKPSEARGLRWGDVDVAQQRLRVCAGPRARAVPPRERWLKLPPDLLPVLAMGVERCAASDPVFQGRRAGTALSLRRMELILREAAAAAGLGSGVTCMTLRHAYAIACLESGASTRGLQAAMGHESLATTEVYRRCLLPGGSVRRPDSVVPADSLMRRFHPGCVSVAAQPRLPETRDSDGLSDGAPHDQVPASVGPAGGPTPTLATEAPQADGCSVPAMFERPLSVEPIELPLRDEASASLLERAATFYRLLKTHLRGRFLGLRRATIRSG